MNLHIRACRLVLALTLPVLSGLAQEAGDDFRAMKSESIGGIKIGLPEKDVLALIKGNPEKGRAQNSEVDGQQHQTWSYKALGIKLDMVQDSTLKTKVVDSIKITAPCTFSTKKGIHLGSSESEVIKAYKADYKPDESEKGQVVLVGSPYGGLLFHLEKGKVSTIFVGASAE